MDEIVGYIERITFQNSENGYTIAQLQQKGRSDLVCTVGSMPALKPGETVRCQGTWQQHLIYGKQFSVTTFHVEAPADVLGIKKYLGSGLIKGIGHKYAARIVEKFGENTLNVIDNEPKRLFEIDGLGKKRVESILNCWLEQKSIREVMVFLQGHDISPSFAQKIFKNYGAQSVKMVTENPYRLAQEIRGIGFKSADKVAQKLGIPKDAPARIAAGIEYALSECAEDGHVCYPLKELVLLTQEMLECTPDLITDALKSLHENHRVELGDIVEAGALEQYVWLKALYMAELGISRQLLRLKNSASILRQIDTKRALEWVQKQLNIQLAENQIQAVTHAMIEKIQIITGGPGTGKSTITKAILAITEQLTSKIFLAAPTGRAAKRMTEITGKKARTIHSLLEYNFQAGGFKKGLDSPLDCDLIIIDEASMIDTYLMYSLLKALPSHTRVICVGDINQLPSVGPGNVLKDMITSLQIPVTALNEIFRQAAGSRIITNAHRINSGTFPDLRNTPDSDFFFIEADSPEQVLKDIITLVTQRIPKKYGFNALEQIQVLAPMKRGIIGTENLNIVLQEELNPKGTPLAWAGRNFRPGDKVMQIRNDHKKEVYNGDIGKIASINTVEQEVVVIFDERNIIYSFSDLDELLLAYAVSIHKYQGSECPCIVMPIHTTHFKLLHRNLLYTGITRGKKLVILVGTKQAIALAVKNDEVKRRHTGLKEALIHLLDRKTKKVFG